MFLTPTGLEFGGWWWGFLYLNRKFVKAIHLLCTIFIPMIPCVTGQGAPNPTGMPGGYEIRWVGNTFSGGEAEGGPLWMQNMITAITVIPDGTVIAVSDWDEAGRCIGIYRDGLTNHQLLKQYDGRGGHKAWGWGTAGHAVAATENHIFVVNTEGELLRFTWQAPDINSASYLDEVQVGEATAMAVRGGRLVVALERGSVEIRSALDLKLLGSFASEDVRSIAVAPDEASLWLIENEEIRHRDFDGVVLSGALMEADLPSALAFSPDGRLLVCDDGPTQQILVYSSGNETKLLQRFGQQGGLRAGVPGAAEPDKLFGLRGAGMDREGNLYVALCLNVQGAGTSIRSFDSRGQLRWQVESHAFCDVYGFDPLSDGTVLHGMDEIIEFDPTSAKVGDGWRLRSLTLDPISYPDDPRLRGRSGAAFVRYPGGRKLLYTIPQMANRVELFVFEEGPSQIARHAGTVLKEGWALQVDELGDLWRGDSPGRQIHRYRFERWTDSGDPVFCMGNPEVFAWPDGITEIGRVIYVPATDTLYLTGYTEELTAPSWGLVGAVLERHDGWTSGQSRRRWRMTLPRDDEGLYPKSLSVAGDYLFTVQVKHTGGIPARVTVIGTADGQTVGTMAPGPEVGGASGWVDMTHGIQAIQRRNGDYLVIVEENFRAKNLIYQRRPLSLSQP